MDDTITGEGLQNLGLYSALRASEQGGIFIMPHLLRHGESFILVSTEGADRPIQSPLTTRMRMWRTYSNLTGLRHYHCFHLRPTLPIQILVVPSDLYR
jgi:hypothetical protein